MSRLRLKLVVLSLSTVLIFVVFLFLAWKAATYHSILVECRRDVYCMAYRYVDLCDIDASYKRLMMFTLGILIISLWRLVKTVREFRSRSRGFSPLLPR